MTKFATGLWAGIELDEPVGKNNGSVGGVQYFVCQQSYGRYSINNNNTNKNSKVCFPNLT